MSDVHMFLKIEGARQGPIRGESSDTLHTNEIEVVGWSWGMDCDGDWYQNKNSKDGGRTTIHELAITKRVDSASTALMSALRNNEPIKKAVLTVCKVSGGAALEYFTITIEKARVISHRIMGVGSPELNEDVRFSFQKVMVEYRIQGVTGSSRGTTTFETEIIKT